MSHLPDRTAVYRLYDYGGELLYVGISFDPEYRWDQHRIEQRWWNEVDLQRADVEWFPTRKEALRAEWAAINSENPRHNRHRNEPYYEWHTIYEPRDSIYEEEWWAS